MFISLSNCSKVVVSTVPLMTIPALFTWNIMKNPIIQNPIGKVQPDFKTSTFC